VTLIQTTNDDEDIKQIEAYGRNNEQVHGGDVRCVVAQEGAPSLGRRSTSLHHVVCTKNLDSDVVVMQSTEESM
jgi:hypothetical protein